MTNAPTFQPTGRTVINNDKVIHEGRTIGRLERNRSNGNWIAYIREDTADGVTYARMPGRFDYPSRFLAAQAIAAYTTPDAS